ncbi:PIN domain-containing protein [Algoriphagus sp. AGSA1]|uniref:PIN domain-containing protein n=1 Tax=Algoriphagus sp. AGSA1 TaxID=2907213 RepID=UPI001F157D3A|nr:PIN domain-containing protein [Algoriphagus sp. AGSA1]MCE7058125.1 PIN domain-containing protein [Algoriphagus sp. AGSA1]
MKIVALLDACVLYPAPIRDFLLNLAEAGLFKPKWTSKIHQEWTRNLIAKRPDLKPERIKRTVELMDGAFPDALVEDYESGITTVELPDPDDRHVLAAAISSNVNYLVTSNLKDFPFEICLKHRIEPIHPDEFVLLLREASPNAVYDSFIYLVKSLKKPPQNMGQVLETLEKCGLEKSVQWLDGFDSITT